MNPAGRGDLEYVYMRREESQQEYVILSSSFDSLRSICARAKNAVLHCASAGDEADDNAAVLAS
jgi:hypothetical protein